MAYALGWGVFGGESALRHGIAISGQTMASFSSPNETFPLPNSSALSLAVVFVDNSYNEEAIKKNPECAARPLFTPSRGSACQLWLRS